MNTRLSHKIASGGSSDGSPKPLAQGEKRFMCVYFRGTEVEGEDGDNEGPDILQDFKPDVYLSLSLFRLCSGRDSKIGVSTRGLLTRNIHVRIRGRSRQSISSHFAKRGHLGRLLEEAMR